MERVGVVGNPRGYLLALLAYVAFDPSLNHVEHGIKPGA